MGVEIEVKFRATPEQLSALEAAFPQPGQEIKMRTTYYDTPAGDFSARHCTLRHRQENEDNICTLKAPTSRFGRGEFEVAGADIHRAQETLCKLSGIRELEALAKKTVVPVCGAAFTRVAKQLSFPRFTAELALDRGRLLGGGREEPLWEAELELKSGDKEAMLLFARRLASQYGLTLEKKSKFRRALNLAKGENNGV